jgi:hypothetical protein
MNKTLDHQAAVVCVKMTAHVETKEAYIKPKKAFSASGVPSSAPHFCLHQTRKASMVYQVSRLQWRRP